MLPSGLCQIFGDGADGRQLVPGHTNGAGSRKAVLPPVPDAMRYKTPPRRWNHSQGERRLTFVTGVL